MHMANVVTVVSTVTTISCVRLKKMCDRVGSAVI